jgi:uncharacterized LabA/DUF88 family protein
MKVMIFLDLDNFRQSLFLTDKKRFYDFGKFQYFIIRFIREKLNYQNCNDESIIRTYAYTGEYNSAMIKKIKENVKIEEIKRKIETQRKFFEITKRFNFFELKTLPLKYENERIIQKGIDVRIAVDLVYNALNNNFDIAVICSGDIDLIEAIKMAKNHGKRIIVASHLNISSKELQREADFFINLAKLKEEELNQFSNLKNIK